MKKRLPALLLCCVLLLGGAAFASENSVENFRRGKTYSHHFSDVSADSVFYDNIAALYEYGLSVGKGDGSFGVRDHVTVGAVLIFAARIRSLYQYGSAEAGANLFRSARDGGVSVSGYAPYADYLAREKVIGTEFSSLYQKTATRAQVAGILAGCLPESALPRTWKNDIEGAWSTGKYIPDVTVSTSYHSEILTLYSCGVTQGSDTRGSYHPSSGISRGALAAMLTRMVDASLRVTPDCSSAWSARGTSWSDLITGSSVYYAAPVTQEQIASDVNYMLRQESNTLNLRYGKRLSKENVDEVLNETLAAVKANCEQLYNQVSCAYQLSTGEIRLSFTVIDRTAAQTRTYREDTLAQAIAVHDQLWKDGTVTWDMTDYQKARVYYTWICQHCTYDYNTTDNSLSHLAYSVFKNGRAVCDGYTGAYNLLLKLEGIGCAALNNDQHIWTVAELDGTRYHIDTTWGDSTETSVDYSYFAMTPEQSWAVHSW